MGVEGQRGRREEMKGRGGGWERAEVVVEGRVSG